jgi:hypothetical protein
VTTLPGTAAFSVDHQRFGVYPFRDSGVLFEACPVPVSIAGAQNSNPPATIGSLSSTLPGTLAFSGGNHRLVVICPSGNCPGLWHFPPAIGSLVSTHLGTLAFPGDHRLVVVYPSGDLCQCLVCRPRRSPRPTLPGTSVSASGVGLWLSSVYPSGDLLPASSAGLVALLGLPFRGPLAGV